MPPRPLVLLVLVLAAAAAGCAGGSRPATRLDGGAAAYRAGEPAFVLEAVASVRDGVPGVDVWLGVPAASLVFRQAGDSLRAVASWTVSVEREGGAPLTRTPRDTLRAAAADGARSAELTWRAERFDAPPGRYLVRAVLEDRVGDRTAERRAEVVVPRPTGRPALGGLRLEGAPAGSDVRPVDVTAVPAGLDSLRVVVQATAVPDGSVTALTVVRYRADTTAASPVSAFTPSEASLVARGVDFGDADTVQAVRQPILNPAEALDVEAPLPPLAPGVYRARVALEAPDGTGLDAAERLFVVRRRDYPQLTRLGDLVAPLVYLAEAGELRPFEEARSVTALRRAFDRFWGADLDDRRVAAATVRAYYERVEEANRLFATQKAGWKTDPGMLYVLFGPPRFVQATPRGERWTYGGGGATPLVFDLDRTAGRLGDPTGTVVLTLRRDRAYDDALRRVRRQWRNGIVP